MQPQHLSAELCLRNSPFFPGASVFLWLLPNSSQPIQLLLLGSQIPVTKEGGSTVFAGDQDANPLYAQDTNHDPVGTSLQTNLKALFPHF